jgi:hypothetical protein
MLAILRNPCKRLVRMSKAQDYELLIWWIFTDFKDKNSGKWLYFYNHYEVHQCDDLLASVQSRGNQFASIGL